MSTEYRTGPSAPTIVWGLISLTVSLLVLSRLIWGISFDPTQVVIAVLLGSGALLLIAGSITLLRGSHRKDSTDESLL